MDASPSCPVCGLDMMVWSVEIFPDTPTHIDPMISIQFKCINPSVCDTTVTYKTTTDYVRVREWVKLL